MFVNESLTQLKISQNFKKLVWLTYNIIYYIDKLHRQYNCQLHIT